MFLLESFKWLHRLHSHDEARRVADCSRGIWHFIEGWREGDWTNLRRVRHENLEEKVLLFLSVESILIYIRDSNTVEKFPPQHRMAGKPRRYPVFHGVMDAMVGGYLIHTLYSSIFFSLQFGYFLSMNGYISRCLAAKSLLIGYLHLWTYIHRN